MSEELNENELEGVSGGAGLPKGSPGSGGARKNERARGRDSEKEFDPEAHHPPAPVVGAPAAPTINVGRGGRR
ncbi:MAG: hypothetical protein OSB25_07575 [Salibacteraceae bacterium]|nr:hypothetical protein [Salibacteraceae bacterium]|tara:strand:+ start:54883 stop:55101 length:219 start_codon:yes stop_codon:yes gene_type:complete